MKILFFHTPRFSKVAFTSSFPVSTTFISFITSFDFFSPFPSVEADYFLESESISSWLSSSSSSLFISSLETISSSSLPYSFTSSSSSTCCYFWDLIDFLDYSSCLRSLSLDLSLIFRCCLVSCTDILNLELKFLIWKSILSF